MLNPLKELFMPKYLVGLEVNTDSIGAVQIFNSLKGPEVIKIAFREVEDPEDIHQELEDFFITEDLNRETLITCIPTSLAIVRQIPLPFHNLKKLRKIIKYQIDPHVPDPIDNTIVDFISSEALEEILTFGIPKKNISEHLEALSRANLEPEVVSLDDIALFYLYVHNHIRGSGQPVSVINLGKREKVVQVIFEKRLDFIRVLQNGTGGVEDLINTFNLYHLKNPDHPLREVLLTGHLEDDTDVAEDLSTRLDIEVSRWRPFDEIRHLLGDIETDLQSRLSVPLGLAIGPRSQSSKVFDLRKEEFSVKTTMNLKRMLTFTLAAILFLVGVFTFNVFQKLYIKEERHKKLKENMRVLIHDAFPDMKNIIKGRELAQMDQKIAEEREKYRWLEDIIGGGKVLDPLLVVSKIVSELPDAKIDNLSIEKGKIRMDGQISSFEMVDRLEKRLAGTDFFKDIKLVGAKMDQKDGAVKFNFVMEKNR